MFLISTIGTIALTNGTREIFFEFVLIEIKSLGEFFNPEVHKCIGVEKDRTKEKDQIISVIENGYMLRGKVIRPASVIIAR